MYISAPRRAEQPSHVLCITKISCDARQQQQRLYMCLAIMHMSEVTHKKEVAEQRGEVACHAALCCERESRQHSTEPSRSIATIHFSKGVPPPRGARACAGACGGSKHVDSSRDYVIPLGLTCDGGATTAQRALRLQHMHKSYFC